MMGRAGPKALGALLQEGTPSRGPLLLNILGVRHSKQPTKVFGVESEIVHREQKKKRKEKSVISSRENKKSLTAWLTNNQNNISSYTYIPSVDLKITPHSGGSVG